MVETKRKFQHIYKRLILRKFTSRTIICKESTTCTGDVETIIIMQHRYLIEIEVDTKQIEFIKLKVSFEIYLQRRLSQKFRNPRLWTRSNFDKQTIMGKRSRIKLNAKSSYARREYAKVYFSDGSTKIINAAYDGKHDIYFYLMRRAILATPMSFDYIVDEYIKTLMFDANRRTQREKAILQDYYNNLSDKLILVLGNKNTEHNEIRSESNTPSCSKWEINNASKKDGCLCQEEVENKCKALVPYIAPRRYPETIFDGLRWTGTLFWYAQQLYGEWKFAQMMAEDENLHVIGEPIFSGYTLKLSSPLENPIYARCETT